MSTDYDLYCVTCKEECGLSDWDHMSEALQNLVANKKAIAAMASGFSVFIRGPHHKYWNDSIIDGRVSFFLEKHLEHEVRVRDEYGGLLGDCCESLCCPTCDTYFRCNLSIGHEGKHTRKDFK